MECPALGLGPGIAILHGWSFSLAVVARAFPSFKQNLNLKLNPTQKKLDPW